MNNNIKDGFNFISKLTFRRVLNMVAVAQAIMFQNLPEKHFMSECLLVFLLNPLHHVTYVARSAQVG